MATKVKNGRKLQGYVSPMKRKEVKEVKEVKRISETTLDIDFDETLRKMKGAKETAVELCVDTLMQGCVSAYLEFFTLSHRDPVCVDELANKMFSIPVNQLQFIEQLLIQAEKARRSTEFREVYDCYVKLANYFEDERDFPTATHFHQLALDNVKHSGDRELEGLANENFGHAHERWGNVEVAIKFHEAHLRIAESIKNTSLKRHVNQNLIRVYMRQAKECEKQAEYLRAREMYEKSMNTARANGDSVAEGEAYHQLGNITVLLGDLDKALEYQKRFLTVAKESCSEINQGKANISMAELQEELGHVSEALTSLQESLDIAERKGDKQAICEACSKLGLLYNKSGNYPKAVKYLEQNYKVAMQTGDTERVNRACVLLGVARGNHLWSNGFVQLVDRDLDAILRWKCGGVMPDFTNK